jgi:bacteriocin-type transport-associated protein
MDSATEPDNGVNDSRPFPTPAVSGFDALAVMGSELRQWFEANGVIEEPAPGTLLIEEGVEEESVYILLGGMARVVTTRSDGIGLELAHLQRGNLTGEMSFLEPSLPVASMVAGEGCRVLAVDRIRLLAAIQESEPLARDLYKLFAEKLSQQLREQNVFVQGMGDGEDGAKATALELFGELIEADLAWLASAGRVVHLEGGEQLIQQGGAVPDLYVVLRGSLRVLLSLQGEESEVGRLGRGEVLGEMSLLTEAGLASASVVGAGPADVLAMDKQLLHRHIGEADAFASRFYRALALLLSRRSRGQLRGHGLASRAKPEQAAIAQEAQPGLAAARARFEALCAALQLR